MDYKETLILYIMLYLWYTCIMFIYLSVPFVLVQIVDVVNFVFYMKHFNKITFCKKNFFLSFNYFKLKMIPNCLFQIQNCSKMYCAINVIFWNNWYALFDYFIFSIIL